MYTKQVAEDVQKKTISGTDLDLFSRKRSVLYSGHHVKDKRREK